MRQKKYKEYEWVVEELDINDDIRDPLYCGNFDSMMHELKGVACYAEVALHVSYTKGETDEPRELAEVYDREWYYINPDGTFKEPDGVPLRFKKMVQREGFKEALKRALALPKGQPI